VALAALRWAECAGRARPECAPNAVAYTAAVRALGSAGRAEEALGLLSEMRSRGLRPTRRTYTEALRALAAGLPRGAGEGRREGAESEAAEARAWELLGQMEEDRVSPDAALLSVLMAVLGRAGNALAVEKVMAWMQAKGAADPRAYAAFAAALGACGHSRRAAEVPREMRGRGMETDVFAWTAAMRAQGARPEEVGRLWEQMRAEGVAPNEVTYGVAMHALERAEGGAQWRECVELLEEASVELGPGGAPALLYNVAMSACGKCGEWQRAAALRVAMEERGVAPDAVTHATLVAALARAGLVDAADSALGEYERSGLRLTEHAYAALVQAHGAAGDMRAAAGARERMRRAGVPETAATYNALMRAHDQRREWDRVLSLWDDMRRRGVQPTAATRALLGDVGAKGAAAVATQQEQWAAASATAAAIAAVVMRLGLF